MNFTLYSMSESNELCLSENMDFSDIPLETVTKIYRGIDNKGNNNEKVIFFNGITTSGTFFWAKLKVEESKDLVNFFIKINNNNNSITGIKKFQKQVMYGTAGLGIHVKTPALDMNVPIEDNELYWNKLSMISKSGIIKKITVSIFKFQKLIQVNTVDYGKQYSLTGIIEPVITVPQDIREIFDSNVPDKEGTQRMKWYYYNSSGTLQSKVFLGSREVIQQIYFTVKQITVSNIKLMYWYVNNKKVIGGKGNEKKEEKEEKKDE